MPKLYLSLNIEPEEGRDDEQTHRGYNRQEKKHIEENLIDSGCNGAPIVGHLLLVFQFFLLAQQTVQRVLNLVLQRRCCARMRDRSACQRDFPTR